MAHPGGLSRRGNEPRTGRMVGPASPNSSIQPPHSYTGAHTLPPALTCPICHFKSWRLPAVPLPLQPGCLSGSWGRGGGTGPAFWALRLCSWFVVFFAMELGKQQEGSRVSVWGVMAKLYMVRDRYLSLRDLESYGSLGYYEWDRGTQTCSLIVLPVPLPPRPLSGIGWAVCGEGAE